MTKNVKFVKEDLPISWDDETGKLNDATDKCKGYLRVSPKVDHSGNDARIRIPNVKIVRNPLLVVLHCTFTMYLPRVHSINQWSSLCKQEMAAPPDQFTAL